jgi:CDP-6-deoxy-D-xylo-4-hexulose-3-dehydrase
VNWLAFPLTLKKNIGFTRYDITKFLEEKGIQTRPIFTGNILKQPAFRALPKKRLRPGGYPNTDHIMRNGFLVGAHHGISAKQLAYMMNCFEEFLCEQC